LWVLAGLAAAHIPDDLDSIANAGKSTAPVVSILHGDDEVVPPKYQRRVADAYVGPKRIVAMPGQHAVALTREASAGRRGRAEVDVGSGRVRNGRHRLRRRRRRCRG
jgi:hypothetical protein